MKKLEIQDTCQIERIETQNEVIDTAALAKEIWNEYFTDIIGKAQVDYMVGRFQSERAMSEFISSGGSYYKIMQGGSQCGYFAITDKEKPGTLFLSKLYVKKEERGLGLSRLAIETIKQLACDKGLPIVWLTVNKGNTHTIDVYKHFGFVIADSVVKDIGGGFVMDDYVMELHIEQRGMING